MPVTPEVRSILDLFEAVGETPREQLTPAELRQGYAALSLVESKAEMASVTDRTIPGPAGDIPVRVYVPTTEPGPRPVLVYFHGGGWVIGDLDTHDGTVRAVAEGSGATVVSVDYRLAPENPFPAAIDDCVAAVRWVADNAAELDVDPARAGGGRRLGRREPGRRRRRRAAGHPRRPALPAADLPGHRRDDDPAVHRRQRRGVLPHQGHDGLVLGAVRRRRRPHGPAGVAGPPARRGPRGPAAGADPHGRVRPAARRGRGLRRPPRRRGRAGHDQPLRRRDPRVLLDARPRARGQGGGRPGLRGAAPRAAADPTAASGPTPPAGPHAADEARNGV